MFVPAPIFIPLLFSDPDDSKDKEDYRREREDIERKTEQEIKYRQWKAKQRDWLFKNDYPAFLEEIEMERKQDEEDYQKLQEELEFRRTVKLEWR
jgi:hypothetical protein